MFSENEVAIMIEIPEVLETIITSRKEFIEKEANFLEISEHDFLSLVMMTPTVGMALANGTVSLFEELALNKMARKMSKGGFFMKIDPVAHAMKFLIKSYDAWEAPFFDIIKLCMAKTLDVNAHSKVEGDREEFGLNSFGIELMQVPYACVRFISSFFLHDESEIVEERSISRIEYEKILDIGAKLGLSETLVFATFCKTFSVKLFLYRLLRIIHTFACSTSMSLKFIKYPTLRVLLLLPIIFIGSSSLAQEKQQEKFTIPLDRFYIDADNVSAFRKMLSKIHFGLALGYGRTFYNQNLDGFSILQQQDSTPLLFDNSLDPSSGNIARGYRYWFNNVQTADDVSVDSSNDFLVNSDTVDLAFKAPGTSIPITATIHVDFLNRYKVGGGFMFEYHRVGDF